MIEKYMPLTVEDLQSNLSNINVFFIMFSVFSVVLLLEFIFRLRNKKIIFVFVEFGFLKSIFMLVSFVFVFFAISMLSERNKKCRRM